MTFNVLATTIPFGSALYVLFSFLILLILVKKFAYTPVNKMIDERQKKINDDLDDAAKASSDAEKAKLDSQEELKQTKIEASSIVDSARQSAAKEAETIIANANQRAAAIQKQAETEAAKAKNDALLAAKNQVADISTDIATEIIGKKINASDQQKLIDQLIDDITKTSTSLTETKGK